MQSYNNLLVCLKEIAPEIENDIQKKINQLEEEAASWRHLYLDASQKLYNSDVMVENQKRIIENTGKVLEELTKENVHLWELMNIYSKRREAR